MTTIERPAPVSTRPGGVSRFAGLGFVVFSIAASTLVLTGPSVYEGGSLDEYSAAYADGARELPSSLAAFILMPVAAALLLWAVTHISTVLTQGAPESAAGRVARLGAVAMATLMTAGAAASSAAEHLASGTGGGFPADPAAGYASTCWGARSVRCRPGVVPSCWSASGWSRGARVACRGGSSGRVSSPRRCSSSRGSSSTCRASSSSSGSPWRASSPHRLPLRLPRQPDSP